MCACGEARKTQLVHRFACGLVVRGRCQSHTLTHSCFPVRCKCRTRDAEVTVSRRQNSLWHDLVETFSIESGTPVVLNTSFNENEPVVDTLAQAVACFRRTDMDVLVLGNFVSTKPGKAL